MPPCLPGLPSAPGTPLNPGGPGSPMVWMWLGSPFGPNHFNWIQKILYHSEFHLSFYALAYKHITLFTTLPGIPGLPGSPGTPSSP